MGDKETKDAVDKAIKDVSGKDPKTGEHPRGDITDPRGAPPVSDRPVSGKPFTGLEPGHLGGEETGHNEIPGKGVGGAPSNRQEPPKKEPGDGPRHG